ncbi:AAA family ATPase [Saccharopolyspora sp. NPDC002578]
MDLVEREEHVDFLDQRVSDCTRGRGHLVLLEGAVGNGKTALLRTLLARAAESGVQCLHAACSPVERNLPLGVLSDLFHAVRPETAASRVVKLLDEGTAVSSLAAPDVEAVDPALVRVFHGLLGVVLERAAAGPVLIAVDDAHHADIPSLHFLLYLVRRARSAPVLVVFTGTGGHGPGRALLHAELLQHSNRSTLHLPPLSRSGTAALVAEQSPAGGPPAPEVFDASGGNPVLARAFLDDARRGEQAPGPGYCRAVRHCLHRAGPDVLAVAGALAVLETADVADVAELATLDIAAATGATRMLAAIGMHVGSGFRHPAMPRAALADVPVERRADLHRRAARLRRRQGASAAGIARHLLAAEHTADSWVPAVLREAADQELRADGWSRAVDYLALAHRACTGRQEQAAARSRLAAAEWQLNPALAARHLAPLAAAARAGELSPRESVPLVRQLLWHGRVAEAGDVLEPLRAQAHEQEAEAVAELQDLERWLAGVHPGAFSRGSTKPAAESPTPVRLRTDPALRSAALAADLLVRGRTKDLVGRAEHVLRDVQIDHRSTWGAEPALLALLALVYADRTRAARHWCDRLVGRLGDGPAPTWRALLGACRAEIAVRQGDLPAAGEHARRAMNELPLEAWGVVAGLPLGALVLAATETGDVDEAAAALALPLPDAVFGSQYGLHYLHARGRNHLAMGRHHAALADFLSCGELMRDWAMDLPGLVPWRTSAAEAWLRQDNRERVRQLAGEQLFRLGSGASRARGLALRVLALGGPPARRPTLLAEAVDLFEDCGDRFELARSLADLSRTLHGLGDRGRARRVLRRAWHVAQQCGARPLCHEILPDPESADRDVPLQGRAKGIELLTTSERRVAALAAVGHTNREIAQKLFITASTVEQHLTRVYRKLEVRYRRELPSELHIDVANSA